MRTAMAVLFSLVTLALCSAAECCKEFCVADCVVCGETCSDNDPQCEASRAAQCNQICTGACDGTGDQWNWWWGCDRYFR